MTTHSQAMRTAVHGKVQPLRPSLWGRIRSMLAEEAAVSRALGHKPQPPLWVGIVVSSAATLVWAAVYFGG
jgi:hypothetical protein